MNDNYNRKINYARISLTSACNLKCLYCSQHNGENINIPIKFYETLIDALCEIGIDKIRFTGGEPLLNKNIAHLVKHTKRHKNIKDIAITTNGILFDNYLEDLYSSGLNRINFSLDTRDKETYKILTGCDSLDLVEKNILLARQRGIKVKINSVLLKSITEVKLEEFLEFGYKNDIQIRFIELMPIGDNIEYFNENYLSSDEIIKKLECKEVFYENNDVAKYYRYKDKYDFGVITPISNHFCNRCNRIRITSEGKLRLCLHSDKEVDLIKYKDDKDEMVRVLKKALCIKPEKHNIENKDFAKSNMVQIGG